MKSLMSLRDWYKLSNIICILGNIVSKGALKVSKTSIKEINVITITNNSLK